MIDGRFAMTHSSYTRQRIFDAFNELLNHMPFEKITVEMIINQSGVSKSTFYRYFHDKYDDLETLCTHIYAIDEGKLGIYKGRRGLGVPIEF